MNAKKKEQVKQQTILECSRIGTWEWNVQTGETVFNEAWATIVGYSLAELEPVSIKTWEKLAHPDDLKKSNQQLEEHFAGKIAYYDIETRMKHKDNHWVWVHDRGKVVSWTEEGKPLLMLGSHDDISDRKKAELSLEESLRLFSSVFNSSPIGIAVLEPGKFQFLRANQGFLNILEYSEAELLEKTVSDITHPEDWERERKVTYQDLQGSLSDYHTEKRYITKSGKIVHVLVRGNTFLNKEGKTLILANVIDITEKKMAEKKIAHLNQVLLAVRNVNQLITKERDRKKLAQGVCDNLIETRGYQSAWIALTNSAGEVDEMAASGLGLKFDELQSRLVSGNSLYCFKQCFSSEGVFLVESPAKTCLDCPLNHQYNNLSAFSVCLRYDGRSYGLLSVSIPVELAHDKFEQSLLQELADDISFALHNLETEKQAAAVIEKQKMLAEMLDTAPSSITIHDMNGVFLFGNQKTYSLHGYTKEEFLKINLYNLDVPESSELLAERFRLINKEGEARFDVAHYRKDGSTFPLEVYAKKILWEGKPAVLSIATDISKRKKAEDLLKESDERFNKMLRAVPDMISIHDREMNIVYSNWNGFASVDKDKRVLGSKCYRTYRGYDKICPDCRAKQVLETKTPFQEEVRLPDGTWVNLRVFPILNSKGEDHFFVEWVQDITVLKQSENDLAAEKEQLMVTLQSIGDGVITTDTKGNIVLMNKTAEEMTGWTAAEAEGKALDQVFQIMNELTHQPCENPVSKVLSSAHVVELANHTVLVSRDKREWLITDSAAPIKNKQNEIIGVVLVFRDMTEKRKFLQITQNSQKLESLGVLAGGIAHDFNNLLGGIYGYIDLAADDMEDNDTASRCLSKAMNTIDRARDLTRQLLTFAKGGSPVQKVEKIFPFAQEVVQFALSGSNVVPRFDISPDIWSSNIDKNQIAQVIDNLVINAVQAMPMGGELVLRASNIRLAEKELPVLKKGDYVRLTIQDSGIGIPQDMLSRIFDPFFTTKAKGHGLGLATCYSIVSQHGGIITVESELGKGSCFHIYLPASQSDSAPIAKKTISSHKGKGTFLVMDDEQVIRDILGKMLESFGYSVVSKADGQQAVDYLVSQKKANQIPAGIILDMTVPGGMSGMETVKQMRKIDKQVPIFVASGFSDNSLMKNPENYGFTASIAKPFRKKELMEMLEKYMN